MTKNTITQEELTKVWMKMELNSVYGVPKPNKIFGLFNSEKANIITEEGIKILGEIKKK